MAVRSCENITNKRKVPQPGERKDGGRVGPFVSKLPPNVEKGKQPRRGVDYVKPVVSKRSDLPYIKPLDE